jgi:hypothetical protein
MGMDVTARRRWFGGLVLLAAAAMLISGQTFLHDRLKGIPFAVYWLACFALTGIAILVAFRDARALHERSRRQHRDLLESTLQQIAADARKKRSGNDPTKQRN